MNRRSFLSLCGAAAVGAVLPNRVYFDMGARPAFGTFLRRGDIFTIDGLFARNPITGLYTPYLQRFVVTADVSTVETTIPIKEFDPKFGPTPSGLKSLLHRSPRRSQVKVLELCSIVNRSGWVSW